MGSNPTRRISLSPTAGESRALRSARRSGVARAVDNPPPVDVAGRMEIVRELCSFEGRLTGQRRRAPGRQPARGAPARARPPGRGRAHDVHPQSPLVHAGALPARLRRQPRLDLGPGARLRARAARRDLDVPRSQLPRLPRPPALLPPRLAERRLPRSQPGRRRPAATSAPTWTPRAAAPSSPATRPPSGADRRELAGAAGPVPDPVLVARAAPAAARRADGGARLERGVGGPARPHPDPAPRHLRPGRDRDLRRRPGRQRQRLRRRHRDLARRRARRGPAAQPRRLGRPRRRRGVPAGGDARLRPPPSPRARPPEHLLRRDRLGRRRRRSLRDQRRLAGQLRDGPPADRALRRDRRGRRRGRGHLRRRAARQRLGGRLDAPAARAHARRSGSPVATPTASSRTATCPPTRPERIDPEALDRAHGFALELVRRLDADLGRATADR